MVVANSMCQTEVVVVPCSWSNVLWLMVNGDGQGYINVKANNLVVNGVERLLFNL